MHDPLIPSRPRLYPYLVLGGSVTLPSEAECKDPTALAVLAKEAG